MALICRFGSEETRAIFRITERANCKNNAQSRRVFLNNIERKHHQIKKYKFKLIKKISYLIYHLFFKILSKNKI